MMMMMMMMLLCWFRHVYDDDVMSVSACVGFGEFCFFYVAPQRFAVLWG